MVVHEGMEVTRTGLTDGADHRSQYGVGAVVLTLLDYVANQLERTRRHKRTLHLLRVEDVRIALLTTVEVGLHRVRELIDPRHHDRVDVMVDCPRQPLLTGRLAHRNCGYAVNGMCLDVVAHTVRCHVAGQEHDAAFGQGHVTQARVARFEQRMQHVLHRLRCLGELIEHDDDGLARLQLKRSVGEILGHPRLAVHARHGDVAKVLLRTVEVGIGVGVTEVLLERTHDRGLADARLTTQEEPIALAGADQGRGFVEGHSGAEVYSGHWYAPRLITQVMVGCGWCAASRDAL